MSRTNFYYLKNFATNRIGWLLVMVNVIIFAYLFKEINFLQEMFHGYCDENGTQIVGFIQSSSLFNFFILINLLPTIIGQHLSSIIFSNYNDSCIYYSYEKYPLVYISKFAIMLLCQSIQWFSIGYGFEKLCRLIINIRDSKHR